jgi:hypothetical protein
MEFARPEAEKKIKGKWGVMPTFGQLWLLIWKPYIHSYLTGSGS